MYGKETTGVIRTTVVIDEKGKIAAIGAVRAKGNAEKTLGLIE